VCYILTALFNEQFVSLTIRCTDLCGCPLELLVALNSLWYL